MAEKKNTKKKLDLAGMTVEELQAEAKKIKIELGKLRFEKSSAKSRNLKRKYYLRKQLARVLTELNAKLFKRGTILKSV
ncbi:50S ribosomal protein L29 [Candidatus Amesbacteria bacterium RIFCSPLOWO2_02_FULL_48_11]|uniref:Large ribosomal subunit protein uL29 n=5 Tax=Microgenomates group TaxID=1794810 RepID=A0A0H4T208_9BACT|nr:hypothetical protein [uncultured Microgenomates bacterium Rifle_16ft_4_minimus_21028]KKU56906.1 MAG: hypothetical protein UX78_C0002G0086 [Candidatus Amesbacteria bacterium GW2011_GWA2_47_11]KKU94855.1 MAG: hypothetical protein UY22_C0005G0012 [Candidatus Amesbacteria bacterium GW2011_GWC1_48_10]KKW01043.1 MAG: hypothetical protein UY33_C0002G0033 [Candidatus Amesbacteria bacterium GW2011_GWA1_48_9]OGC89623.1 MAG: 50S ribosomal protein L29 [Candidatus Amesbacteria bacterium RBG_19FT_COMBO_48